MPDLDSINYTIGLLTLLGIGLAVWRSKSRRRMNAVADAILGQDAVTDASGGIIRRGEPGLVARVGEVEKAVVEFRHIIGILTETQKRIDLIDQRVGKLEDLRIDRLVNQFETGQMLRLAADVQAMPDEPLPPAPDEQP